MKRFGADAVAKNGKNGRPHRAGMAADALPQRAANGRFIVPPRPDNAACAAADPPLRSANAHFASSPLRAGNGKKAMLLTRESIDGRTRARRQFDAIAEGIAADLGGADQLSVVQRHLIEAFAGSCIALQAINTRILLGEQVDICDQSSAASTLVRIASRLGVTRIAKDVTPDLQTYLRKYSNQGATPPSEAD